MPKYHVLQAIGDDSYQMVSDPKKPIEAPGIPQALRQYLTGKPHPETALVPVAVRHFEPIDPKDIEIEDRAPKITIKGKKKRSPSRGKQK
jgi:hypothetical protein